MRASVGTNRAVAGGTTAPWRPPPVGAPRATRSPATTRRVDATRIARERALRIAAIVVAFALALIVDRALAADAAPPRDPIEGHWWGEIGSPRERVAAGLSFTRDATGALVARQTLPMLNVYDGETGAAPVRDGDRVTIEAMALDLRLVDGELVGTYPGPNSPARFRHVASLPREAPIPSLPTGPAPRWETRVGGQVYASPVVVDGVIYLGTTGGVVNAVSARDGAFVWTHAAGTPIHGAVAVDADGVYFSGDDGALVKLARRDGAVLWRTALGAGGVARVLPHAQVYAWDWQGPQPLLIDDTVYVGDAHGLFHAIDAATGVVRWRFATGGKIRNGAARSGEQVIVASADRFVYALDRATGREAWRAQTLAEPDATPVRYGDRVLVGDRGGGLYSLDAATGTLDWRLFFWGSWVESTPVVVDDVIYVGASDLRRVSAIEPATGRVRWRQDVYGWTWGTPLVVGSRVYAGTAGGTPYFIRHAAGFVTLDRATGRVRSRWPLPDAGGHQWGIAGSPVRAGDVVVVATIAGSLLAFPIGDEGTR